jgi:hypothetical protein
MEEVILTVYRINVVPFAAHDSSCGEMESATESGPREQKEAPSDTIHDGEHATGGYDEDRILDDGGSEGSVAFLFWMLAAGNRKKMRCRIIRPRTCPDMLKM